MTYELKVAGLTRQLKLSSISDELMVARTVYAVDDVNVSYQSTFRRASAEQLAEWKSTYTNPLK